MVRDGYHRSLTDLRISVTDRCNFRCTYCMPSDEYAWLDRAEILTYEEIARLARIFVGLGVEKVRITGGEPLVRNDLEKLLAELCAINGLQDLSLTTNGSLLAEKVHALTEAGLRRINVSLDTLDPEKFRKTTRRGDLADVLDGLFAAKQYGLHPIKINAVIERGVNDDEIIDLVGFARKHGFALRFIEFMDVGNANEWSPTKVVSKREILQRINSQYPLREIGRDGGCAPSVDYRFLDGIGDIGVIASVTEPFCSSCTRARLTADGRLVTCLFSQDGRDLKGPLRGGATDREIEQLICAVWREREDRFSEERLAAMNSAGGYCAGDHRKMEMIRLGG